VLRPDWKEGSFAGDIWGKGEFRSFLEVVRGEMAGRGVRGRGRGRGRGEEDLWGGRGGAGRMDDDQWGGGGAPAWWNQGFLPGAFQPPP
jgi:hypothetical protein